MVELLKEIRAESFGQFPICGDLLEISSDFVEISMNSLAIRGKSPKRSTVFRMISKN
jgi:hypothetical protein